jgi:hypothetical protein
VQKRRKCSLIPGILSLGLLVGASTAWADSTSDATAGLPIEGLKDSVVERLANCETRGRPDASSVVIIDTNNKASIGKLQFQAETVVSYTKLIEGRTIDRKEAMQIALDGERAASRRGSSLRKTASVTGTCVLNSCAWHQKLSSSNH